MGEAGRDRNMTNLHKKTAIYAVIAAIIYLIFFFFLDKPIDLWVHAHWSETWIYTWGTNISTVATGSYFMLVLALCFLLIIICDSIMKVRWTRILLNICVSVAIAIIIGEGLKYLLGRHRPVMLFEQDLYGLEFFSTEWELNSTPSGHTIRAFSLLTALSMLYRRFIPLFIFIATLIGLSRIVVTAHYPSDVVFGAFIGIFTALWVYKYYFLKDSEPGT
jgi:membrane-associated phospholipid phosphatase